MFAAGLVDEVRALLARPGMHPDLPSLRAVGYRQVAQTLAGTAPADPPTLRERGIAATRQLAKRQLTWVRGELDARWFDPVTERTRLDAAVAGFLGIAF